MSEISIPDGVEEIGGSAFAYTDLNEITIPAGVKKIGEDVFFTDGRDLVINNLSEIEL